MVNLNDQQKAALDKFTLWAGQRYTLARQFEDEIERRRKEFYAAYENLGYEVVQQAVEHRVPKKRLGEAYGTSDKKTIDRLIEKYATDTVAAVQRVAPAQDAPLQPVVEVTFEGETPYLTVRDWPSEVHPGTFLNYTDVELKKNGLVAQRSDDLLPLNHELFQDTSLQARVREEVGGNG